MSFAWLQAGVRQRLFLQPNRRGVALLDDSFARNAHPSTKKTPNLFPTKVILGGEGVLAETLASSLVWLAGDDIGAKCHSRRCYFR
jgi:hypothetical protein